MHQHCVFFHDLQPHVDNPLQGRPGATTSQGTNQQPCRQRLQAAGVWQAGSRGLARHRKVQRDVECCRTQSQATPPSKMAGLQDTLRSGNVVSCDRVERGWRGAASAKVRSAEVDHPGARALGGERHRQHTEPGASSKTSAHGILHPHFIGVARSLHAPCTCLPAPTPQISL